VQAKVIAEMTEDGTGRIQLHNQPFATAEKVRDVIVDTYRQLKQRRVDIQRKMSLYLANRDTEFILFKPMKVCLVLYLLSGCSEQRDERLCFLWLGVTFGIVSVQLRFTADFTEKTHS